MLADLTLNLFGPFRATLNGEPLPQFRTVKVQALLIFLVVESDVTHRREALMELLWPGLPLKAAQINLRQTLFRLRKMIPELTRVDGEQKVPFLLSDRLTIRVNPDVAFEVDFGRFDNLIDQSSRHDHLNLVSCRECWERLKLTANLYSGSFLADFYLTDSNNFEGWAAAKREAYRRQALDVLDTLTTVELQRGAFVEAQAFARQQIEIDYLDERAYRRLFEALARNGRRNQALAEYDKLRELLALELGIEPSKETRQLYKRLSSGEQLPAVALEKAEHSFILDLASPSETPPFSPSFLTEEEGDREKGKVFVGRESELSRLHGFLDEAVASRGGVVFVTGDAGRGKTSLLNEFAQQAQAAHPDLVVASGVCDAYSGTGDAYLPFRDVMAMLMGDAETHWSTGDITRDHALRLWHLLPTTASVIIEQTPELLDVFVSAEFLASRLAAISFNEGRKLLQERLARLIHAGRQRQDQDQLFGAYTEFLKMMAKQHPLVWILDDLHWADASSVNLLFHLARRLGQSRILILGAYRPEDILLRKDGREHPLKAILGDLKRHFGDIWVDLDQGDQAESRRFLDALLDSETNRLGERFRQELFHHTQGHPLFTVELLRDMQVRGDLVQDDGGYWNESPDLGWDSFPAKVEGVIEKRIGRLEPELLELLTVASVEGESFTAEVIAGVMKVDEQALVRRLSSELDKQHRLVRVSSLERLGAQRLSHYRFRHNLFQRRLYIGLDEVERAYLHEAVGNELEHLYGRQLDRLEAGASHLARHFRNAGDKERALKYTRLAANRAIRQFAHEEAIQHLETALDLLENGDQVKTRLSLLEELADVYSVYTTETQAIATYQAALEQWASMAGADNLIAVRLHRKILDFAFLLYGNIPFDRFDPLLQTLATSGDFLEANLSLADRGQSQLEIVRVLSALANYRGTVVGSPSALDAAERHAQAAVELGGQLDAPVEMSDALEALARIYYVRGMLPEQLEASRQRLTLSEDPRFRDLRRRSHILESVSDALIAVGKYDQAFSHLLELGDLTSKMGAWTDHIWALSLQALCLFRLDRWEELLRIDEKRQELERHHSSDYLGGGYCVILSLSAAARALQGHFDQARTQREQSYEFMLGDATEPHEKWGRGEFY